ncbi:hypothetical protein DFH09DRAFT_1217556, partial [Mycena vulgaris]
HATSDTCTMDEEESVLGFTEEHGRIHTHPTRSCFMSSLPTVLPESFAVVWAPKSDPKDVSFFETYFAPSSAAAVLV